MNHTKEPWSIDQYGNINDGAGDQLGLGGVVTHCTCGKGMLQDRANARRIVACVNACTGIETEHLERFCGIHADAKATIAALEAKVRELEEYKVGWDSTNAHQLAAELRLRSELRASRAQVERLVGALRLYAAFAQNTLGYTDSDYMVRLGNEALAAVERERHNGQAKKQTMEDDSKYKRFMLFTYAQYYPGGGVSDCDASFDTLEEAIAAAEKEVADFKEILDLDERKVVLERA